MSLEDQYEVRRIPGGRGKAFIREHHYSRSCHNGPMTWGMFERGEDELVGVIAFATPSSENVRASVFGVENKASVTELHRLVILDVTPKNAESWLIAKGLRGLLEERPHIRCVLSFADATEGHVGTIYQASNALFCGTTGRATFYRDGDGRLRHPRQNGVNITASEARRRGWVPERREAKNRYAFLVGTRDQKRWARRNLRLTPLEYPKGVSP